jgi:hypothetical protein
MDIDLQKHWWIVPAILGVIGLVALILAYQFLFGLVPYLLILFSILVGLGFLWSFLKWDVWWAVGPAIVALALALALFVDLFLPENNGWVTTLILGASAFVIAIIPNRRIEVNVAHFVGIAILVIGFLVSPLRPMWKIIFIVASLLLAGYLLWLDRKDMKRLFAS